jgi:hypothetical protein
MHMIYISCVCNCSVADTVLRPLLGDCIIAMEPPRDPWKGSAISEHVDPANSFSEILSGGMHATVVPLLGNWNTTLCQPPFAPHCLMASSPRITVSVFSSGVFEKGHEWIVRE